MTGLYGGAFDPPHLGHVALARAALQHFGLEQLVVLVSARPGHREVVLSVDERLRLAELAFDGLGPVDVRRDDHARTIDLLRAGGFGDAIFLIGADQLLDFPAWKEPDAILELVQLGVATRPGLSREEVEAARDRLSRPERVHFFEIEPHPVSGRELRALAGRGESLDGLVPTTVAREVAARGLYRLQGAARRPRP
jgi:nicotinate-nucleotide adenylyltransferase